MLPFTQSYILNHPKAGETHWLRLIDSLVREGTGMRLDIFVPKIFVKPMLWLTQFFHDRNAVLVCKGYGDDWEYYTGLYWDEDKDLEVQWYEDYRVWINFYGLWDTNRIQKWPKLGTYPRNSCI